MKKKQSKTPMCNENSISWNIFCFLKQGLSSRDELIYRLIEKMNNTKNSKDKLIDKKSLRNNINLNLQYLRENRKGWYKFYELIETDKMICIKEKKVLKIFEKIKGVKNGNC